MLRDNPLFDVGIAFAESTSAQFDSWDPAWLLNAEPNHFGCRRAFLGFGMIRVIKKSGAFVQKGGLRLLERNTMLCLI